MAIDGTYEFRRRIHPFGSKDTAPSKPAKIDRKAVAQGVRGMFSRLTQKGGRR